MNQFTGGWIWFMLFKIGIWRESFLSWTCFILLRSKVMEWIPFVGSLLRKRALRLVSITKFYMEFRFLPYHGKVFGSQKFHQGFPSFYELPLWGNPNSQESAKKEFVLVCWYTLCKDDGETVNHLLLHYPFLKALWDMVFALFGIHWLMPWKVIDLLACRQGHFGWHRYCAVWRCIRHCLMWFIWRERNNQSFEGCERSVSELKQLVLNTLFEWVSASGCFSCLNFNSFLVFVHFRCSRGCTVYVLYLPIVHILCLILMHFLLLKKKKKNELGLFFGWY